MRCEVKWQRWLERQEKSITMTNRRLSSLIIDGGNPTGVGFKLVTYSRTLKENRGGAPFGKRTRPFQRVLPRGCLNPEILILSSFSCSALSEEER